MEDNIPKFKQKNNVAGILKFILPILVLLILIIILLVWRYNIKIEEKYFNTLQELAEHYYPNEKVVYLNEGDYYYVIADRKNNRSQKFVYKTPEGKYIYLQELLLERFKRRKYFELKNIEEQNFHSFIRVEIHEENCIILMGTYSVIYKSPDMKVYDSFGQLEPTLTSGTNYYITMIDINSITKDYELRVEIGNDSYYVIGANEIGRAK